MSDSSENTIPETEEAKPPLTPGEQLRDARETAGESLKDVAARTHQSIDTLKALEAMQTGRLSPTVVRMQADRYARALGLSGKVIADGFAQQRTMMDVERIEQKTVSLGGLFRAGALPVLAATLFAVIAGGAFVMVTADRSASIDSIPVSKRLIERESASLQANLSAGPLSGAQLDEVSITALKPAWIEVRGSDGTIFRSRTMAAGEVYYPRMNAGWTVTVRNAGAFAWTLGGEQVMPLGQDDVPVYSVNIDTAAKQASDVWRQHLADAAKQ